MRVLHVIDSAGLYGAENVILELMSIQKKLDVEPALLSIGKTGVGQKDIEAFAIKRGLETHALRFRDGLNVRGAFRIIAKAKEIKTDLIHSHGYKGNILLNVFPKKIRRIPVISTIHGWTNTKIFTNLWFYHLVELICLKNCEKLTSVSGSILNNKLIKLLTLKPVVIHNGIPKLNFNNIAFIKKYPVIANYCKRSFTVTTIGRLSGEKGHEILIKAIAALKKKGLSINLVIFGEGPRRAFLDEMIYRENVGENVILAGYNPEACFLLPLFDIFILPSLTEGLPLTLLEALQAGVPIIATKVGEVPKVLQNGRYGNLVAPGDWRELIQAIEKMCNSYPKALDSAIEAKEMVLNTYTVESMAKNYLTEYRKVLNNITH